MCECLYITDKTETLLTKTKIDNPVLFYKSNLTKYQANMRENLSTLINKNVCTLGMAAREKPFKIGHMVN